MDRTYEFQRQWEDMDPTQAHINKQHDEITRLRAEVERLREALGGLLKTIDAPGYILREQQAIECLGSDTPLSRARAALHEGREDG